MWGGAVVVVIEVPTCDMVVICVGADVNVVAYV